MQRTPPNIYGAATARELPAGNEWDTSARTAAASCSLDAVTTARSSIGYGGFVGTKGHFGLGASYPPLSFLHKWIATLAQRASIRYEAVALGRPETVESYWSRGRLPSAGEQADALILWIGDNQADNASPVTIEELSLDAWIGAALPKSPGAASGLRWILDAMEKEGRAPKFFLHNLISSRVTLQLTMVGWERYAALKRVQNESRTAFMAMKFGDAELNNVVDQCFRPAVERAVARAN